jgi:ElaB/YqjD/DUF883 family membrane-anchored ribosome-binding protein
MTRWMDSMGKDLLHHVYVISSKVDEGLTTVKEIGDGVKPVIERLSNTTEIVQKRVVDIDAFLSETTDTARQEIIQIREKIDAAVNKAEEVLQMLHDSILIPINQVSAVTRGIKAGIDALFRRKKHPQRTSGQDEEMYI